MDVRDRLLDSDLTRHGYLTVMPIRSGAAQSAVLAHDLAEGPDESHVEPDQHLRPPRGLRDEQEVLHRGQDSKHDPRDQTRLLSREYRPADDQGDDTDEHVDPTPGREVELVHVVRGPDEDVISAHRREALEKLKDTQHDHDDASEQR